MPYCYERPFGDLSEGKEWLMSLLASKGFQDISETSQYQHWDLEASYEGQTWAFELKNRSFPSTKYNDASIDRYKYQHLIDCPRERVVLVNFWTDRWCLIDIRSLLPTETITRECQKTTRFNDKTIWSKKMVTWPIQDLVLLDYDKI